MKTDTKSLTIGRYHISFPVFHTFALDGGAMFGSIPKTLWNKQISADSQNRIPLVSRSLLIEDGTRRILVDVGLGSRWNEKYRDIYQIRLRDTVENSKITDVILTHLHFDHAGGIATGGPDDAVLPSFPHASVFVSKKNLETAKHPHPREKASYLPYIVEALEKHSLTATNSGDQVAPGITLHQADGHTLGLQWIKISDGGHTLLFPSDLLPTSHHAHPAYHMGFDMCARTALEEKEVFLQLAHSQGALIVFQHDPSVIVGTVEKTEQNRFVVKERLLENGDVTDT